MDVLILFGSPRKQGNTAAMLHPFLEELETGGANVQYMDVYEKNIHGCRACLICQENQSQICCSIQDDMQPILRVLEESSLIVVAAPIYLWSAPAPVKAVLDRMVYSSCKYYSGNPYGSALLKGKHLAAIAACGYPVERATDLYEESLRRFCKHCQLEYAGLCAARQRNLKDMFMDEEKERAVRDFAKKLLAECRG